MKKIELRSVNGYEIPCIENIAGNEKKVIIIIHGLGSTKESPTAVNLSNHASELKIGTISFDFPAHGDSTAQSKMFRIDNCMSDLSSVENYIREILPDSEIMYFASSFGAYITLLYFAKGKPLGSRAFLRCAAVNMPELFKVTNKENEAKLHRDGFFTIPGTYVRPLEITGDFLEDLENNDLFSIFRENIGDIHMIHGNADETVPISAAVKFSNKFSIPLTVINGADHRFTTEGATEKVIETALSFFLK